MMDKAGREYVRLKMPIIGLGTYEIKSEKVIKDIIDAALEVGYRFFDTAQVYGNEKYIGSALKELLPKYNLTRSDVFITSKLAPRYQGSRYAEKWILKSLQNLQTDYLDLLLIHWPGCFSVSSTDPQNKVLRRESWEAMEKLYREKKLRAIGVSNYNTNHLDELLAHASVLPAVNQCEYHPLYYQADLVNYCKEKEIHFQAYSSFGSESNKEDLLKNPKIISLASKYGCSVTNFLLAWSINQGISVLPRSRNPIHVKENFRALSIKLDAEDIEAAKASEQNKFCWNPSSIV